MSTHVDDQIVQNALSRVRRDMNRRVRDGLKEAASQVAIPRVRITAATVTAPYLTVGATTRAAYITTRGPKVYDRIAGLLEFGGQVTSDIYPKKGQAVITPYGPRSAVYRGPFKGEPARITGQHRIRKGVEQALPRMADVAREEIVEAFGPLAV